MELSILISIIVCLLCPVAIVLLIRNNNKQREKEWQYVLLNDARLEFIERKQQWLIMASLIGLSLAEAERLFQERVRLDKTRLL